MSARLAFVDTETTGLDPVLHEIWEVGLIVREPDGRETEHQWHLPVDLGRADPMALNIGQFHKRAGMKGFAAPSDFVTEFVGLTRGAHLVGAVVSFDERRLWDLLRANGECPMWHYHLIDVEALVAGKLGLAPPWKSDDLSSAVGVDPEQFDRHTAVGDARWARALYDAVLPGSSGE